MKRQWFLTGCRLLFSSRRVVMNLIRTKHAWRISTLNSHFSFTILSPLLFSFFFRLPLLSASYWLNEIAILSTVDLWSDHLKPVYNTFTAYTRLVVAERGPESMWSTISSSLLLMPSGETTRTTMRRVHLLHLNRQTGRLLYWMCRWWRCPVLGSLCWDTFQRTITDCTHYLCVVEAGDVLLRDEGPIEGLRRKDKGEGKRRRRGDEMTHRQTSDDTGNGGNKG